MDIKNQYITLQMLHLGRWYVDKQSGLVYNGRTKKEASHSIINEYKQYGLSLGYSKGMFQAYGHCIVYLSVYGLFNPDHVIDHRDHVRANNSIYNLQCITQRQNTKWVQPRKETKPFQRRRLSTFEKAQILVRARQGASHVSIAEEFKITRQSAARVTREEWAKLGNNDKANWLLT